MPPLVRAILDGLALVGLVAFAVAFPGDIVKHGHFLWVAGAAAAIDGMKQYALWQEQREARQPLAIYRTRSNKPTEAIQQAALKALSDAARGRAWITRLLVVCIAVPTLLEVFVGIDESVARASVEPVAIRDGAWWRLLTGTYLHGSVVHFTGNMTALLLYGSILETKTSRYRLPLVYLLSCLGGSALSVAIPPDVPSIGASGGIVGIIGYLFLFSRRREELFPDGFRAATAAVFASLITMGAIGFWYIDNPGHAGGALMGIMLAALLVDQALSYGDEISLPIMDFIGLMAMAVLIGGSVITTMLLLGMTPIV
ncbi:MAG TPA: rhomboid family intramembrane serine protease [Vicinamibacterales bacterium]|nr:rhomboid family intramembrane serine protease [Vicinamibacterales bacterium]